MKISLLKLFSIIFIFSCSKNYKNSSKPYLKSNKTNIASSNNSYLKTRTFVFNFTDSSEDKVKDIAIIAKDEFISSLESLKNLTIVDSDFINGFKDFKEPENNIDKAQNILVSNDILTYFTANIERFNVEKEKTKKGLFRVENVKLFISINLQIQDLKNKKTIFNKTINGKDDYSKSTLWTSTDEEYFDKNALKKLFREMFDKTMPYIYAAVSRLTWNGRIAKISFSNIYINAGRKSGIQIGDILKVIDLGEEVRDPNTGNFIGVAPGRIKGTVEITSYFGEDGSIATIHTGGGFSVGDKVELY